MTALIANLNSQGFFQYAKRGAADDFQLQFEKLGWPAVFGESGRLFHADAEQLAEGGVGQFLLRLNPFLERVGIHILDVDDALSDSDYWVTVNGDRWKMYAADELLREERQPGLIWGLTSARCFLGVNKLLEDSNVEERLYAVNGGNDLFGFFLSKALHCTICAYPGVARKHWPYILSEKYSLFGQGEQGYGVAR